ncbi:5-formyltetrahydrofolate cyclo-ligase [Bacillus timonensis]|nr:5-formyltetrahydrofolate cyclo-ligase [Bacillus timonensis]
MLDKKVLRKEMRSILASINDETYQKWSQQIANKLHEMSLWKKANVIGMTISTGREVDTIRLIERCWQEGKKVVVPKCNPKEKQMIFREIRSFGQLEVVYYNLQEPIESETIEVPKEKIDLLIVPGIAYTHSGYRLGQGGGYFDRYLQDYKRDTISLSFTPQIVNELPLEQYDIPVKYIITNERVIKCHE